MIVGAGAAGLAAAEELCAGGMKVLVLEARPRIGGRIHTIQGLATPGSPVGSGHRPVELGAEFIHGAKNQCWPLIKAAGLSTDEVPDRHWTFRAGKLKEEKEFWDQLENAFSGLDEDGQDLTFARFLKKQAGLDDQTKSLARTYVEGFHAADADRIGITAIAKSEEAAERTDGTKQFRIGEGYGALIQWLAERVENRGAVLLCDRPVRQVKWKNRIVEVTASGPQGKGIERYTVDQLIVTVPLGVLQCSTAEGRIEFDPPLGAKSEAIHALAMGSVAKITLEFSQPFWPVEDFGFVHRTTNRSPPGGLMGSCPG